MIGAAIEEITAELRLKDAFLEHGPPHRPWRTLRRSGLIEEASGEVTARDLGRVLSEGVAFEIDDCSRVVLVGDQDVEIEPRQLAVAVAVADYIVAVAGLRR